MLQDTPVDHDRSAAVPPLMGPEQSAEPEVPSMDMMQVRALLLPSRCISPSWWQFDLLPRPSLVEASLELEPFTAGAPGKPGWKTAGGHGEAKPTVATETVAKQEKRPPPKPGSKEAEEAAKQNGRGTSERPTEEVDTGTEEREPGRSA